jgi:hypothetical protein
VTRVAGAILGKKADLGMMSQVTQGLNPDKMSVVPPGRFRSRRRCKEERDMHFEEIKRQSNWSMG